jgi:hypothetical protein
MERRIATIPGHAPAIRPILFQSCVAGKYGVMNQMDQLKRKVRKKKIRIS